MKRKHQRKRKKLCKIKNPEALLHVVNEGEEF